MRLTRALEDRIAAFDNICLRRILRISYMDHVTNADVRLSTAAVAAHLNKTAPLLFACGTDGRLA